MQSISIIGAGQLGKALASLFYQKNLLQIKSVLNRSLASSTKAINEIRAGKPANDFSDLEKSDIFLISTNDSAIAKCASMLAEQDIINSDTIVFHCSGNLSSNELIALKLKGASIASLHPIRSFADSNDLTLESFKGTYCAVEGDLKATNFLTKIFQSLNAYTFLIKSDQKSLYHSASVFASNYLVSLIELSLKALEQTGISRELGYKILEPLVKNTTNNIFTLSTGPALTGPIARADYSVVKDHISELTQWNKDYAELYRALGLIALELAVNINGEKEPLTESYRILEKLLKAKCLV